MKARSEVSIRGNVITLRGQAAAKVVKAAATLGVEPDKLVNDAIAGAVLDSIAKQGLRLVK